NRSRATSPSRARSRRACIELNGAGAAVDWRRSSQLPVVVPRKSNAARRAARQHRPIDCSELVAVAVIAGRAAARTVGITEPALGTVALAHAIERLRALLRRQFTETLAQVALLLGRQFAKRLHALAQFLLLFGCQALELLEPSRQFGA